MHKIHVKFCNVSFNEIYKIHIRLKDRKMSKYFQESYLVISKLSPLSHLILLKIRGWREFNFEILNEKLTFFFFFFKSNSM